MKKRNVLFIASMLMALMLVGCDSSNQGNTNSKAEANQALKSNPSVGTCIPEAGTVWSYTQSFFDEDVDIEDDDIKEIKSYFVFKSNNEVLWFWSTPKENMIPIGDGNFDASSGQLSFSASYPLLKNISIYLDREDPITFNVDLDKMTAVLNMDGKDWKDAERSDREDVNETLMHIYNEGQVFSLTKENYTMSIQEDLVGSKWVMYDTRGYISLYFRSWNEVVWKEGEDESDVWEEWSLFYVVLNNMVAINIGIGGDDFTDDSFKTFIGKYSGEDEMTLCLDGLFPERDVYLTFNRMIE